MATSKEQADSVLKDEQKTGITTRTGWRYTVKRIKEDPSARIGLYIIGFMSGLAIFTTIDSQLLNYYIAESVWHHPERDPTEPNRVLPPVGLSNEFGSGTWSHPLGTDQRGRDILVRVIYGSRIAITVGIVSTGLGMLGGVIIGAVAGYYGHLVDDVLMRVVEILYSIPLLILALLFMAVFGRDIIFAMLAVSLVSVPVFARLIRSRVVSVREETYIEAARASGAVDRDIIIRHVIPNSFAPVIVQATLQVGINILIIAGLSFLGFGVQPPTPSWGQMLADSQTYMIPNPWFSVWPGLAILFTVVGFNTFGDGLRDALDPQLDN